MCLKLQQRESRIFISERSYKNKNWINSVKCYKFLHDKQLRENPKLKGIQVNKKVAVRNYAPEIRWKIDRFTAREGIFHYRIQGDSSIW